MRLDRAPRAHPALGRDSAGRGGELQVPRERRVPKGGRQVPRRAADLGKERRVGPERMGSQRIVGPRGSPKEDSGSREEDGGSREEDNRSREE